jgi:hypothetical protein
MAQPRYTLIAGDFYILYPDLPGNGPEPDGDTINFLPDHDGLVQNLQQFSNKAPDRRHLGTYPVRFEGIDTLETHFPDHRFHQNLQFAEAARNHLLQQLGFGAVTFLSGSKRNKVATAEHHPVRGYLFANGIESNGRILGMVYPVSRRPHWAPTTATACSSPPTSSTPASTPNTSVTASHTASCTTRCRSHLPITSPRP